MPQRLPHAIAGPDATLRQGAVHSRAERICEESGGQEVVVSSATVLTVGLRSWKAARPYFKRRSQLAAEFFNVQGCAGRLGQFNFLRVNEIVVTEEIRDLRQDAANRHSVSVGAIARSRSRL